MNAHAPIATVLLLLALASVCKAEERSAEVRQAIDSGNAQYIAACAHLDAAAFAAIYDRDGARLDRGGEVVYGRDNIAKVTGAEWQKLPGPLMVTINTTDLWLVDDLAYETGLYTIAVKPPDGAPKQISGRYVTIWKRQYEGGWKIFRDMNVSQDSTAPGS